MKNWVRPSAIQEDFMTDNAVSSCGSYQASLYCAIPGADKNHVNDGNSIRFDSEHHKHDLCGSPGNANITDGVGHEAGIFGNSMYDIKIGSQVSGLSDYVTSDIGTYNGTDFKVGSYYKASWKSKDALNIVYKHYGIAQVNGVEGFDPAHPNRS